MMPAVACGTIRTERTTVTRTKKATTPTAIRAPIEHLLPPREPAVRSRSCVIGRKHDRRRAVDLDDVDRGAGGDDQVVVVRAGAPHLAADAYPAAAAVDSGHRGGTATDQGSGPGLQ